MQVVSCKNRICLKYIQPDMQTDEFHPNQPIRVCIFHLLLNQRVKSPYPREKVGIELVPRNCV